MKRGSVATRERSGAHERRLEEEVTHEGEQNGSRFIEPMRNVMICEQAIRETVKAEDRRANQAMRNRRERRCESGRET